MPVFNAMPYLAVAIESLLAQTFTDFELIIGDDGSTDGSAACIAEFAARDSRIRVLPPVGQLGPALISSHIAAAVRAPVMARMDADDRCHPDRLRLQYEALEAHPAAVLVWSLFRMMNRAGRPIRGVDHNILIRRATPEMLHPSMMFRVDAFKRVGGYRSGTDFFEDLDLIERLQTAGELLVVTTPLVDYRMAISSRLDQGQSDLENQIDKAPWIHGDRPPPANPRRTIHPLAFKSIGSLRLWSHRPAGILNGMARRMELRPLAPALGVMAWASVVTFLPPLARQGSRLRLGWRNWRIRREVQPNRLYRWRAGGLPDDLGPVEVRRA